MNDLQQILVSAIQAQERGEIDEAVRLFKAALEMHPGHPAACYSLGVIAIRREDPADALHWAEVGMAAAPGYAPLRFLAGSALRAAGASGEAALQRFDEAIALQPDYIEALVNSGVALRDMLRHKEALERFNQVLAINPDYTTALANCAVLLTEFKQSEEAIAMFKHLLEVQPDYDYGPGLLCFERLHVCDWTDYDETVNKIIGEVRAGRRSCKSLAMMAISDFAGDHFQSARIFGEHLYPSGSRRLWQGEVYRHDRIRLAYISPDLREHPVGHLMAGVFEHHDRSRFELIAISLGIDDKSRLRGRMLKAFDRFIDAKTMSPPQIAQLIRSLEVDVAVDLAGYTADSHPEVLAQRPAPVQVNFLGYAGSMGVDYMDYLIADRHVAPREHWPYYSEKIVYMPDAYLPTDGSVEIPEEAPGRSAYGLPETGLVFCAFSHDYKISPGIFAIWMRLLKRTKGSVLWLMSRSEISQKNLWAAAEAQGVDAARLIFATRVPRVEDHLARYRLADFFLDTYPYNAHTTAADALMAGVPVVTCMGEAFHARVAGSLVHAAGLPELATHSLADYEALALALAAQPERVSRLKAHLRETRASSPLFDTANFCRNLEAIYISMWRKYRLGTAPDSL
ncbi:O-linked N-acetylglucosamine transferase, SPINDLY family protein [Sulfuritalea hydrogenivorans]|uniref:protein O-GlcNAc transferase n=1 Tax=Sulfuritalea hydrogenivorans sk43H TaxID=1223802 RepID=W0SDB8_9PROT|nr:glycosyltransferase family 41 protein [Sulfuritalea hydrogenivorans]MDK9715024.1 tetratricopeptide repeat protein [Sulfuritalea sp.]BAO28755.1 putative O-linked N-acetylglucosamine transferase, SPINDLY family [Sulfuritalea hydrogenivorans sk43H]